MRCLSTRKRLCNFVPWTRVRNSHLQSSPPHACSVDDRSEAILSCALRRRIRPCFRAFRHSGEFCAALATNVEARLGLDEFLPIGKCDRHRAVLGISKSKMGFANLTPAEVLCSGTGHRTRLWGEATPGRARQPGKNPGLAGFRRGTAGGQISQGDSQYRLTRSFAKRAGSGFITLTDCWPVSAQRPA